MRKTYRTKRTALAAAHGKEVYKVVGGYRISRGAKVRGKRGRALKRRIAKRTKSKKRKKAKRKKPLKYIKIKLGNPNPRVCGFS